ncbi:HigA family addiction module antitoxin [Mucilaginibacter sp.]|uniref:HigA family addiction module antitoxin n=1 Tax=Mucilaginibacter sp. TaxID=1882438 RepID=UPI003D13FE58
MVNQVYSKNGEEIKTDFLLHPGEVLLDEIEARELKKSAVAAELQMLPGHLSELFKGKRTITALTAVKLEKVLGVSAEFWIGLQTDFDLAVARKLYQVA